MIVLIFCDPQSCSDIRGLSVHHFATNAKFRLLEFVIEPVESKAFIFFT